MYYDNFSNSLPCIIRHIKMGLHIWIDIMSRRNISMLGNKVSVEYFLDN